MPGISADFGGEGDGAGRHWVIRPFNFLHSLLFKLEPFIRRNRRSDRGSLHLHRLVDVGAVRVEKLGGFMGSLARLFRF